MATTYEDLLNVRKVLINFPQAAVDEVSKLWQWIANGADVDFEIEALRIATEAGVSVEHVKTYYNWYEEERPDRIVIFYNERKWLDGQECFDAKCDNDFLPKGSVIAGLITIDGAMLSLPSIGDSQTQQKQLLAVVQKGLLTMWITEYTAEQLLAYRIVTF